MFENYHKPARRDEFLNTMEAIVLCAVPGEVIEPEYPKAGNVRPPIGLERMLRIHFSSIGSTWLKCCTVTSSAYKATSPMPIAFATHFISML